MKYLLCAGVIVCGLFSSNAEARCIETGNVMQPCAYEANFLAVTFQRQNPSFRKSHWLLRLFGWLVLMHGGALALLMALALAVGVL